MADAPPCPICDEVAGRIVAPGGPIYDDGLWLVSHHTGAWTDPGEVLVKLRRHVESLAQVTPEEAATLGPILRAGVEAVERSVAPERTYVMSFNERLRHLHFYILPRTRSLPRGHVMSDLYKRGRAVLRQTGITPNPSAADRAAMAERLRADPAWIRLKS
jgi:diadenosine tetraphosphate (Ap4A) HIT family hydrolase